MGVQTEQKTEQKTNIRVKWGKIDKINLVYALGGGILGSAIFAVCTLGGQGVANAATLIAGLGGGIISGVLTLSGVRYTINDQRRVADEKKRKEHKDSIIEKNLYLRKLKESVTECRHTVVDVAVSKKYLESSTNIEEFKERLQKFDEIRQKLESKLIVESLKINSEVYKATIQCIEMMQSYSFSARVVFLDYGSSDISEKKEEIIKLISESYRLLNKQVLELDTTVSQELRELEKEMFK